MGCTRVQRNLKWKHDRFFFAGLSSFRISEAHVYLQAGGVGNKEDHREHISLVRLVRRKEVAIGGILLSIWTSMVSPNGVVKRRCSNMKRKLLIFVVVLMPLLYFMDSRIDVCWRQRRLSKSINTPDWIFPCSNNQVCGQPNIDTQGQLEMNTSRVIIAGLLRNKVKMVPLIREQTELVGSQFRDYRILLMVRSQNQSWRNSFRKMTAKMVQDKKFSNGQVKTRGFQPWDVESMHSNAIYIGLQLLGIQLTMEESKRWQLFEMNTSHTWTNSTATLTTWSFGIWTSMDLSIWTDCGMDFTTFIKTTRNHTKNWMQCVLLVSFQIIFGGGDTLMHLLTSKLDRRLTL